MPTGAVIRVTAYTVSATWSLILALAGLRLPTTWSRLVSFMPLLLVLIFAAWDNYLWRLPPFVYLAAQPDLRGTWLGHIDAQWIEADGKLNEASEETALLVNQSYSQISVTLMTAKSKSYSVLAQIRRLGSGEYCLAYQYSNTPVVKFRQQLVAHAGSAEVKTSGPRPAKMAGEYWTNRLSRGSLEFARISRRRAGDLAEAQAYMTTSSSRGM